jgi:hypothetical protein
MAMKPPRSYLANAAMASAVLYFAQDLSRGDRGAVDWTVLGLVTLAILWNLVRLGQRLHRGGGDKSLWHLLRTLLFWIVGLFNTALIRPEEVGSWKNIVGWVLLAVAVVDTIALARKEQAALRPPEARQSE